MSNEKENRYKQIVEHIFFDEKFGNYKRGTGDIGFSMKDLRRAVKVLGIEIPGNLPDAIYSIRYRTPMPRRVVETQPEGREWVIGGAGKGLYKFYLVPINRIRPNPALRAIKVPDATPEIIAGYTLNDEQALLAKVRYNRLIDTFLGVTAYSLQNHMRTTVKGVGQIEIDEVYVAVDRRGVQFVIPVQAKSGKDQLSVIQTKQDLECCAEKFAPLQCRSVSAQFMNVGKPDERIAMFELAEEEGKMVIVEEKHYRLVASKEISVEDLRAYGTS